MWSWTALCCAVRDDTLLLDPDKQAVLKAYVAFLTENGTGAFSGVDTCVARVCFKDTEAIIELRVQAQWKTSEGATIDIAQVVKEYILLHADTGESVGKTPRGGIERKLQVLLDEVKNDAKGNNILDAASRIDTNKG